MTTKILNGTKITAQMMPPPLPLAWVPLANATGTVDALHHAHYRAIWQSRGIFDRLMIVALLALWPVFTLVRIILATVPHAGMARAASGKGILRQAWEQLVLAARFGFRPDYYYKLELYLPQCYARAAGYVHRFATKDTLYRLLKPPAGTTTPLSDKVGFAQYAASKGIKVAPVIAAFAKGRIVGTSRDLPPKDLFIKRTRGRGGSRAELWRYADGRYRHQDGLECDAAGLLSRLSTLSKREPYLVQERLVNDPALRDLAQDALATVRVVTAINEEGAAEAIRAVFRMPSRKGSIVDNYHAGGIAAAVDLTTGRLGAATDKGFLKSVGWVDRHPVSGALIKDRVLPHWPEMLALVLDAHQAFADRAIIGWDVALTDQGLVIIEGNAASDTDIIQRCHRAPLSETRYPDLMYWHIMRAGRLDQP
ncbi:sugar-transfer associated ATP-grasp domain-containing protein [Dongia rigui]|uniref:Sugar-transfer associated ATP-grasp domain-containing protein n=1 Tax=Dongia rigui TaxID=940149 RepID=A0ABU5DYM7_9PROT|nr:sugar-transfer associated ATP-grasp domain-containing protein [Dongia rigui]MDY0871666.1 sugar-transfer associated ATP-grasp domain-containing protein [Dongia rigui]